MASSINQSNNSIVKKTRFVLVSDTHSTYPKLPKGDILIHAGDLTNQGSISELKRTLDWIDEADCEIKVVIGGNHDITLDKSFYTRYGNGFHSQNPQDPDECIGLINSYPNIVYLCHSSVRIILNSPDGPQTTCRIFGSPYVPARGKWAFGYQPGSSTAEHLWSEIPLDTDIVVTHTPPYNHLDTSPKWGSAGCEGLRKALWQVRPRLAVCGHVHESRGVERVKWKLDYLPYTPFLEEKTIQWIDPGAGNKKMSLVDLTRKGGNPLLNDGAFGILPFENVVSFSGGKEGHGTADMSSGMHSSPNPTPYSSDSSVSKSEGTTQQRSRFETAEKQDVFSRTSNVPPESLSRLHRRNTAALDCRYGREETCVVNAAIMAKSYGNGPKRSNKPIVVDLELPVLEKVALDGDYLGPTE